MFEASLLRAIRERFCHVDQCPFTGPRIFFENAGGALTLKSVVEKSAEFAAIPDNQGRDNPASAALMATIATAKEDTHCFLGSTSGDVFVGESGTELLFRLIRTAALAAAPGGNMVGSSLEHPATASAGRQWAEHTDRPYVRIQHDPQTGTVSADDYRAHITAETRVATIIHTSPVSGIGVDVAPVVQCIREIAPDCLIIVDGIQHAAHGQVDLGVIDIDGYAISPYKVFSRHGYGLAWVSDRLAAMPHEKLDGSAERQWEFGTRDTGSYATFSEVVDYLCWLGQQVGDSDDRRQQILDAGHAIGAHEHGLVQMMLHGTEGRKGLADMPSVTVIGGADNPLREGLVSIAVQGIAATEVVSELRGKGIRTHTRKADYFSGNILDPLGLDGAIRVSMGHYNSPEEIVVFLDAMADIIA